MANLPDCMACTCSFDEGCRAERMIAAKLARSLTEPVIKRRAKREQVRHISTEPTRRQRVMAAVKEIREMQSK